MCGINGYFQFNPILKTQQISGMITKMNDKIIHRGPDDDGLYISEDIGLGMRRLSIIDLSTGKQPIFNEDNTKVIVFNGEIYNYKDLRDKLVAKGHHMKTFSDTEVILHCYEEYGNDCFNLLKGMFSIAIFDIEEKKLILARDRAGEKPLYYSINNNSIIFASELKSIIVTEIVERKINKSALNQYLQLTYIPAPLTIFENIYKVRAGCFIEIQSDGRIENCQYWNVIYNNANLIEDYNECKKQLRETMFKSVEECMVSDVPIGAFLSGGIDSTIIVGIMSKLSNVPINTFTIGFRQKDFNESDRAQKVADFYKTNHDVYYLEGKNIHKFIGKMLKNIDEPFADSSYIPTYMVSQFAKTKVKTVLTGDASDELFGGYNKYLIGYYSEKYKSIPLFVREKILHKIIYSLPDNSSLIHKIRKVIENSENDIFKQRVNLMCLGFKTSELKLILKDDFIVENSLDIISDYYNDEKLITSELSKALYVDLKVTLEGDMLAKVDRASMLCSLETRVPFLQKDVIEIASKIPSRFKVSNSKKKVILKDTFSDLIPKGLMNANKKGFGVPIGQWLRDELKEDLTSLLNFEKIEKQGIFKSAYVNLLMNEHNSFTKDRSSELWTLYVFSKWYEEYMK